jgi:hypothetical protein
MKFMLMMQGTRKNWESMYEWAPAEIKAHIEFMKGFARELAQAGELVLAEGLDLPTNAKIVTGKGGPPVITDGPFAESKEFLAGFWIVDVPTPERAIEIAGAASAAPGPGGKPLGIPIEIRQVMSGPPDIP